MATNIIAADTGSAFTVTPDASGAFAFQTGAFGAKVTALTLDASGNAAVLGTVTAPTVLATTANATTMQQGGVALGRMVLATAQNTTSGTSIDFTGIPSWVKRITVMLNNVSTNGTSATQLQIGSGSVVTSGYVGGVALAGASAGSQTWTTGLALTNGNSAALSSTGHAVFTHVGGNVWVGSLCTTRQTDGYGIVASTTLTLGGTLDRIRLTTVNGTDTFDAGSVNILYEG